MGNKEVALQIALTLIDKGVYVLPEEQTMESFGEAFANLYNAILDSLAE